MQVQITQELENIIASRVAHGMNQSPGDVLREALYLLVERDRSWGDHREEMDHQIQMAMDEMKRGEGITEAQLLRHIEARKSAYLASRV